MWWFWGFVWGFFKHVEIFLTISTSKFTRLAVYSFFLINLAVVESLVKRCHQLFRILLTVCVTALLRVLVLLCKSLYGLNRLFLHHELGKGLPPSRI